MLGPIIDCLEGLRLGEVEDDDNCVAVFVVEGEQGPELLLACGVPDVHLDGLAFGVEGLVAVEAGAEGVGYFGLEGAVEEDLDDAGLADV